MHANVLRLLQIRGPEALTPAIALGLITLGGQPVLLGAQYTTLGG